jgi:hypothetical protein
MADVTYYFYDSETGLYAGWTDSADVGETPSNATLVAPPATPTPRGWMWNGDEWEAAPEPVEVPTWDTVRRQRDGLLMMSDWTQLADAPLDATAKQNWVNYRQSLRDLPQTFANPDDVIWPEAP